MRKGGVGWMHACLYLLELFLSCSVLVSGMGYKVIVEVFWPQGRVLLPEDLNAKLGKSNDVVGMFGKATSNSNGSLWIESFPNGNKSAMDCNTSGNSSVMDCNRAD